MRRLLFLTALLALSVPATADAATRWVVKGGGWGHGLGMSQYGAYGQALDGRGYRKILHHYYRNTTFGQASGRVRVLLLASVGSSTFGGANKRGHKEHQPDRNYPVRRVGGPIVVRTPRGKRSRAARASSASGPERPGDRGRQGRLPRRHRVPPRPVRRRHGGEPGRARELHPGRRAERVARQLAARGTQGTGGGGASYALGTERATPSSTTTTPSRRRSTAATAARDADQPRGRAHQGRGPSLQRRGDRRLLPLDVGRLHREQREHLAGRAPLPYIRGVPDPWDKSSPYHHWRLTYSAPSLGGAMGVGRLRPCASTSAACPAGSSARRSAARRPQPADGWNGIRGASDCATSPARSSGSGEGLDRKGRIAGLGSRGSRVTSSDRSRPPARARRSSSSVASTALARAATGRLGQSGRYRIAVEGAGLYRVVTGGDPAPLCAYARRVPIPKVDPDRPPTRVKRLLMPFALSKPGAGTASTSRAGSIRS